MTEEAGPGAGVEGPSPPDLVLYQTFTCPWCSRVRAAAEALGITLVSRDTGRDLEALQELYRARGRAQVPVLRIQRGEAVEWMPESAHIVAYLRARFGGAGGPAGGG